VICNQSIEAGKPDEIVAALKAQVRKVIGAIAVPDRIQIVPGLPKTRSGKIMRRILRKIAESHYDQLGDISTLAEPQVVELIVKGHKEGK
jgi:acetyl-CoA synthetase